MQILTINNFSYNQRFQTQQNFLGHGKPITLQYIVQKRANILPPVILEKAKEALNNAQNNIPTLMEIHNQRYAPLRSCKTMQDVKKLYPEFANIKETVGFKRESVYTRSFREKAGDNFVLNTLKAYWCDLKTLDEIAHSLGMQNHSSMQRALEHVNFVTYPHNYKTILYSSDPKGNEIIAQKTTAWNAMHPDLMMAKNKHAAQGCKKESYRKAKSKSMKEFYDKHPERREKMSESLRENWQNCPEIRKAMSEFFSKESSYIRNLISKKRRGAKLNAEEDKIAKSFYKKFWEAHPELKKVFSETRKGSKVT